MRSFKSDKRAAIWIWAVCFMAIIVYAIIWFALGWCFNLFIDALELSYTFQSPADLTVNFIKIVVAWHPILFILGMLLWAFVNSQRREEVTYPY